MRIGQVTTWYLEMLDPAALRPAHEPALPLAVERAEIPSPELGRFLYSAVGGHWYWTDRLTWTHERWARHLSKPGVETWVGSVRGTPAGYAELQAQPQGNVEIAFFGLLRQFIGQGLGGHLLTVVTRRAWDSGARRVWLHTCSLDGPSALSNYQARGFRVYDERTHATRLPDEPPGPWPGWR
jgi:ribosomal protein S18 acetylase RimI-like enzyme